MSDEKQPEMVKWVMLAIADNIQALLPDGMTIDYEYAARAAIEAMRDPTEEMRDAMRYFLGARFNVDPQWRAAIDEALK